MSVITVYECDWCNARAPESNFEDPEGWESLDGVLLCTGCVLARAEAIKSAEISRRTHS